MKSLEAVERAVIGSVLLWGHEALTRLDGPLRPEHFSDPRLAATWAAIAQLDADQRVIETVSVRQQLERHGDLDKVGEDLLLELGADVGAVVGAAARYRKDIVRASIRRQAERAARKVAVAAKDPQVGDEDFTRDALEEMERALDTRDVQAAGPMTLAEGFAAVCEQARAGRKPGIATGFVELDRRLGGLRPGEQIVIAAQTSVGKSALATSIATHVAQDAGHVYLASYEMSAPEVVERIVASEATVDGSRMRNHDLREMDWRRIEAVAERFVDRLHIDDAPGDLPQLRSRIRHAHRKHGLRLAVVDYLQLVSPGTRTGTREEAVAQVSRELKLLALELQIPILVLSQFNRAFRDRKDPKPQLSDLRESGAVEQNANAVIALHRTDELDRIEQVEVHILKQRSGAKSTFNLRFSRQYTRFENLRPTELRRQDA